jgi:DNA polymerase-3 subunit delta'
LSGGDVELARLLASERGAALRATAEAAARAPLSDVDARARESATRFMLEPWRELLEAASEAGQAAGAEEERRLLEEAETMGKRGRSGDARAPHLTREAIEQVRRTERRARTQALDLGLALCCAWYRDLAAIAAGAEDVVLNDDRRAELAEDAEGLDPAPARRAVEWVLDTRRRLRVNVSEELALEALWLRLASALSAA